MTSYTEREKMLLTHLIRENNAIEDKRTDIASLGEKRLAWELITTSYNSQPEVTTKRTMAQLKKLWNNLKIRKRKMNTELRHSMLATGGGPHIRPVVDPVLESVEVAAPNLDVSIACPWDSVALFEIEEGVVSGSPTEVSESMEETIEQPIESESSTTPTGLSMVSPVASAAAKPSITSCVSPVPGPSKSTPAGRGCKRSLPASVDIERKTRVRKVERAILQEQELHNLRKKILQEELLRAQLETQRAEEDFLRAQLERQRAQLERQRAQEDLLRAQLERQKAADEASFFPGSRLSKAFNMAPFRSISFPLKPPAPPTMMLILLFATFLPLSVIAVGCPAGCMCNDDTFVVQCERSKLDVIPITLNPAIQRLVLRNNKIKTVDAAFQFYRDLQYVDLSSNHLVNIPTKSFLHQEKLQELHLNKNKLSSVNNKTFQGLKSLTVLNLRENFLEELSRGIFSILPKLEELNLGQNRISKIDELAFDGLLSLRVLFLDDNLLTSVPTPAFPVMGSLAELHVGLNGFVGLPDDSFQGLSKLSVLDLSSGGISTINEHAFRGLSGLRNLNLADNRLEQIPTTQLGYMARLEELTIGQNEFVSLKKGSFKGLTNLRKLDITGAKNLEHIERGVFSDNMNLETIVLVSNKKLENLDEGALVGLPNLRHLVLRENAFKSLPESVVSWSDLRALELTDNPINCDCQILWLLNLANKKNLTNVQCASPLQLRDKPLKTLTVDDLGCSFGDRSKLVLIVTFCASGAIILLVLGVCLYRYRLKVRDALKDYKFNTRPMSRKEHEYQKTFSDDEYTLRTGQLPIKHIPVTEL